MLRQCAVTVGFSRGPAGHCRVWSVVDLSRSLFMHGSSALLSFRLPTSAVSLSSRRHRLATLRQQLEREKKRLQGEEEEVAERAKKLEE